MNYETNNTSAKNTKSNGSHEAPQMPQAQAVSAEPSATQVLALTLGKTLVEIAEVYKPLAITHVECSILKMKAQANTVVEIETAVAAAMSAQIKALGALPAPTTVEEARDRLNFLREYQAVAVLKRTITHTDHTDKCEEEESKFR